MDKEASTVITSRYVPSILLLHEENSSNIWTNCKLIVLLKKVKSLETYVAH